MRISCPFNISLSDRSESPSGNVKVSLVMCNTKLRFFDATNIARMHCTNLLHWLWLHLLFRQKALQVSLVYSPPLSVVLLSLWKQSPFTGLKRNSDLQMFLCNWNVSAVPVQICHTLKERIISKMEVLMHWVDPWGGGGLLCRNLSTALVFRPRRIKRSSLSESHWHYRCRRQHRG